LKLSKKGIADRSPQQVRASSTPTSSRSFSSDAIARDAGHLLTSTEGVVALFAYACGTLSRPEGIIDHAVDDRRNRVRHGLMGEFCDARQLAPPVNGGRQPIRKVRGQGQVHRRSISNENVGWRRSHSVVSVAAISGPIAALS
jgi:hypothetical protein